MRVCLRRELTFSENNLKLQEPLYQLRSDTKDAFDDAKHWEARWKEIEREQRELYQVSDKFYDTLMYTDIAVSSAMIPSSCSCG